MASGAAGDLAVEITNLNDRTVAIENGIGTTAGAAGTMVGMRLIARTVLGAAAASVTFSSIPGIFENLVVQILGRSSAAVVGDGVLTRLNGDTGANYEWDNLWSANAAASGNQGLAQTSLSLGSINGASSPAGYGASIRLWFPGYARTTYNKVAQLLNANDQAGTSGTLFTQTGIGMWKSTVSVNSVGFTLNSGSTFGVGCVFSVYGEG